MISPSSNLMDLMIRKLGYEPVLIANGLEALELIKKEPPALILLDIMMVPINGWEFLEKLRGDLRNAGDAGYSFYRLTSG